MNVTDPYSTLASRIRGGVYPEGTRLASERALAEEFNVARTTIRRAIARLHSDGLLESRPGCRPVVCAAVPPRSQMKAVALLIGSEETYKPFSQILRGCETELRRHGYLLVYLDTWAETPQAQQTRGEREHEALENLRRHGVTGLILWCQDPESSLPLLKQMREEGTAIVTIDREVPGGPFDHIGVDNARSAIEATQHLIDLGHRRIAFATARDDNASTVRDREEGFRQALRRNGRDERNNPVIGFPFYATPAEMAGVLRPMVEAGDLPDAFFAMNDLYASRLVQALRSLGVNVPSNVSVIGFDDTEPPGIDGRILTTVRQPFQEIGRVAAQTVLQRLQEPFIPTRRILVETTLIERSSTHSTRGAGAPATGALPAR